MDLPAFVEQCQRRGEQRRKHRDLIKALHDLRLDHDWAEIENAVKEAKYESEQTWEKS